MDELVTDGELPTSNSVAQDIDLVRYSSHVFGDRRCFG